MNKKEKAAPHCNAEAATKSKSNYILRRIWQNVKLLAIFALICGGLAILGGVENGGIATGAALLACAVLTVCGVMAARGITND